MTVKMSGDQQNSNRPRSTRQDTEPRQTNGIQKQNDKHVNKGWVQRKAIGIFLH